LNWCAEKTPPFVSNKVREATVRRNYGQRDSFRWHALLSVGGDRYCLWVHDSATICVTTL